MASKTDLRAYFRCKAAGSEGPAAKKKQIANLEMTIPATENVNRAEIEMVINWNSLDHSTKDALEKFSKQYPKFTFKCTSINSWKTLLRKKNGDNQTFIKKGRPYLFPETLFKKMKNVIVGSRLAGTVISRRMRIAIGTGVVKANDPKLLHL